MEKDVPLLGGHPALDLVNTLDRDPATGGSRADHVATPPALLSWADRVGIVTAPEVGAIADAWRRDPGSGPTAVDAVRDIREALHICLLAAMGLTAEVGSAHAIALERLRCRWSAAAGRSALVFEPASGRAARLAVGVVPAQLVPDRLAVTALELLQTADLTRLRCCPPDLGGCGWLFLDRTRNASRRWCRMEDCGSQAKSQRLTERRRADRARDR